MCFGKRLGLILVAAFLMQAVSVPAAYAEKSESSDIEPSAGATAAPGLEASYFDYMGKYKKEARPADTITVRGADYTGEEQSGAYSGSYAGRDGVLIWDTSEGRVEWRLNVPKTGLYNINITYCAVKSKGNDIELGLRIDGEYPFYGSKDISLFRIWRDAGGITEDERGNHIRPKQEEVFEWQTRSLADTYGQYNDPYMFYFTEGEHIISLELLAEALAIDSISLGRQKAVLSYSEIMAKDAGKGYTNSSGYMKIFEAETPHYKSSIVLIPTEDRSDVAVSPSHPYLIRLNTIGKNTWKLSGQWISWKIDVPEDGYYQLSFKARQNMTRGMNSTRRLYIDGEVPFEEMNNVRFPYSLSWYMKTLCDDSKSPYLFYLKAGEHEIKLEIISGDMANTLREIEGVVFELNNWYRKVIMITGSNPDAYRNMIDINRDFLLDEKIPGLMTGFSDIAKRLKVQLDYINSISQGEGNAASMIKEIIVQLEKFVKEPETIPLRLDSYRNNVSSLASWLLEMRDQPLELDYFVVSSPGEKLPAAKANILDQIAFRLNMFFNSFVQDYNAVGSVHTGKALNVWVSTTELAGTANTGFFSGRDQAQVIKSMVDDMFTSKYRIGVNLSLVNSSATLVQATLAQKGPDAALFVSRDTPVNLAMRGALMDLTEFDKYKDIAGRFYRSAVIPYEYNGGVYALPETQSFDMLFCRTDVFSELGLEIPETWDEFYALLPVLQQNNMQVGIYESQSTFEALLYQRNSSFYNEKLTATAFDRPQALEAFRQWTGLYAKYSLPLVFDFFNRFRNGEMPLAIMTYTNCNYINAAAPELRNLWVMAPIPGIRQPDGTINRAETCNSTASIILSNTKMPDEAFQFISWWTDTEAQSRFGYGLEELMGASARYPTANVKSFDSLPWSKTQAENLKAQWESVTSIPQVPGNYYINRNISFAFRAVVYNYANERETLYRYNREINKEIRRKREEFGLPTE